MSEVITTWELEAWIYRLGSVPIKLIKEQDLSEPYEMEMARVFLLENGKYALVIESGCSCYEPRDAEIEIFPNEKQALAQMNVWVRENKRHE